MLSSAKPQTLLGAVLIIVGALLLTYQGITLLTHKRTAAAKSSEDAGPFDPFNVVPGKDEVLPLSSIVGTFALGGGIFLFVLGSRKV